MAPGPGAYEPNFNAQAPELPKYSIKGRYQPRKRDQIPAPGAYEMNHNTKLTAPSFGFGSSPQRGPLSGKAQDVPGPGNYKIPVQVATKNSYIATTLEEKY